MAGEDVALGSIATAALLTAVAASPKPTAISRTLPGYSVMSPAAKTRCRLVRIAESTTTCRLSRVRPHSFIAPRSAMKPSAATTACAGRVVTSSPSTVMSIDSRVPLPCSAVTSARVTMSTEEARTWSTVRAWARNASRRWTSVTDFAIGSRCSAQSKALSPPPTITTSLPTYGSKLGTKNSTPRPTQSSAAGSGRGLNLPMPAVISIALARTSVPSSSPTVTPSGFEASVVAVRPSR